MRKILCYLCLGCMGVLAGCEEEHFDGVSPDEYILFSKPSMSVESRSTFLAEIPSGSSFGVLGYCVPFVNNTETPDWAAGDAVWISKMVNSHADVFYNTEISVNEDGCAYTNLKKWYTTEDSGGVTATDDYYYTFFAYYPFDGMTVLSPTNETDIALPKFQYSMPFTTDAENQVLNDSDVKDVMIAVEYNRRKMNGNVAFNFSHILTGLGFEVCNYNESKPVTIKSISLVGDFWKTITVTMEGSSYTTAYSDTYAGRYQVATEGFTVEPGSTKLAGNKHLLLQPGTEETPFGNNVRLLVSYEFNGNTVENKVIPLNDEESGKFLPESGTKYTVQLNFIGDTFVLRFVVDNNEYWEDGGDSDINIQ